MDMLSNNICKGILFYIFLQTKYYHTVHQIFLGDSMRLYKTNFDVYYIHEYIPEYKWDNFNSDDTEISQRLLRYKRKNKEYAFNFFTNELTEAIINFSNNILVDVNEIVLVAVPPSKVDKYSPIRLSISRIKNNTEIKSKFNFIDKINDGGELLMRIKDVSTSHKERRALYSEHILSIDFNEDLAESYGENAVYIILDDITTTGLIMDVCRDILIDYNIDENKIYRLAIGSTID